MAKPPMKELVQGKPYIRKVREFNFNPRRGHIHVEAVLGKPVIPLDLFTEFRTSARSSKIVLTWKGEVENLGQVSLRLAFRHREGALPIDVGPDVNLPYQLSNARSEYETRGKYEILRRVELKDPHDNIIVKLVVTANGSRAEYQTDLDLVGRRGDGYVVGEVLNGKSTRLVGAVTNKSEVWKKLREVGIPINEVYLYVFPKSVTGFRQFKLPKIIAELTKKGLNGSIIVNSVPNDEVYEF